MCFSLKDVKIFLIKYFANDCEAGVLFNLTFHLFNGPQAQIDTLLKMRHKMWHKKEFLGGYCFKKNLFQPDIIAGCHTAFNMSGIPLKWAMTMINNTHTHKAKKKKKRMTVMSLGAHNSVAAVEVLLFVRLWKQLSVYWETVCLRKTTVLV